ncbi:helix-turn-helix transcriptional regulator [Actinoplanes sp. NPDC048967]|uniref:helix-turn-helix domain-containing protein n=1 Tax=Actinoplanes sp. NPDC048967 TaxID=3155269 RepID=UPI0033D49D08
MSGNVGVPPSLGEIIRRRREQAELPMRRLASMVGISGPYLSQIERDLRAPSERVLRGIAGALRTTADALRGEAGPGDAIPGVLSAIAADPRLSARQRQALTEVYQAFVATGGHDDRPGD